MVFPEFLLLYLWVTMAYLDILSFFYINPAVSWADPNLKYILFSPGMGAAKVGFFGFPIHSFLVFWAAPLTLNLFSYAIIIFWFLEAYSETLGNVTSTISAYDVGMNVICI